MNKDELIQEIKYSLPDKRLLYVVRFGAVKVNGELVILKNRYDHIPTIGLIDYEVPYGYEHEPKDIQGRSVVFSPDTLGRRGLIAMVKLAELMDKN